MEVAYLSAEEIAAFQEALAGVIEKYKGEYGAEACEAFLIP